VKRIQLHVRNLQNANIGASFSKHAVLLSYLFTVRVDVVFDTTRVALSYGVFTWASGDTYLGDWVNGQRHGVGLFRSVDGREFCGQWSRGVRHGWGCLTHANGEDYEGEFKDGKVTEPVCTCIGEMVINSLVLCTLVLSFLFYFLSFPLIAFLSALFSLFPFARLLVCIRKVHGVGRLTSPNGDVYQGAFRANKFHGLGRFTKGNGDTYLGQCSNGRAEGWVWLLEQRKKRKNIFALIHWMGV
jgi:hypothetical protein